MVFIFVINRNFKMQFEINLKRKNKNKIYGKGVILNNSSTDSLRRGPK